MSQSDPAAELSALLERVQDGDESALLVLLQHYEPRLRTAARVLLGPLLRPHLDSLDLVQSVHRILLPGLREGKYDFADPEQLIGLALTVLRRKVANNWRKQKPYRPLGPDDAAGPQLPSSHPGDDPERAAQGRDVLEHLRSLVSGAERELLELRLQGLGAVEIAARLGCAPHVLRARLRRLRQKLRAAGAGEWV